MLESDHRIRLHRAPHDSAQNEAERTNAAIGEALTTGRPVEPPADPFHGLTASQMDSMTLKEVEEHCSSWKWRILGSWLEKSQIEFVMSLGLGSTISLISVSSYSKKQQILHFLAKYLIQWKKAPASKRSKMYGNSLVFEASKVKGRSCTTRALLLRVSEVCL